MADHPVVEQRGAHMVEGQAQGPESGSLQAIGIPRPRPGRGQLRPAERPHQVQVVEHHGPAPRRPAPGDGEDEEQEERAHRLHGAPASAMRAETDGGRSAWKAWTARASSAASAGRVTKNVTLRSATPTSSPTFPPPTATPSA